VINALSVVLLPRLSMMAERETERFGEVTGTLSLMINAFALPAACGVARYGGGYLGNRELFLSRKSNTLSAQKRNCPRGRRHDKLL
jgi:hypothetical protein